MSLILDTGLILIPTWHESNYSKIISINSSANLHLFSTDPPYLSFLLFDSDLMNESTKYPWAPWSWIPSNLHSLASFMLFLKSFLVYSMSYKLIALGISWSMFNLRWRSRIGIYDGANVWRPLFVAFKLALPPWNICKKIFEPFWWTASTTLFQPSACSLL